MFIQYKSRQAAERAGKALEAFLSGIARKAHEILGEQHATEKQNQEQVRKALKGYFGIEVKFESDGSRIIYKM